MREIELPRGKVTLVDDADYDLLSQHRWCCNRDGYAVRRTEQGTVLMHRVVNNTPAGVETDHVNGDKLDNRRSNLRTVSHKANCANRPKRSDSRMPYKGIQFDPRKNVNPWQAHIGVNGKAKHLGMFASAEDAARAYDAAARAQFGEFARLNFPDAVSA